MKRVNKYSGDNESDTTSDEYERLETDNDDIEIGKSEIQKNQCSALMLIQIYIGSYRTPLFSLTQWLNFVHVETCGNLTRWHTSQQLDQKLFFN